MSWTAWFWAKLGNSFLNFSAWSSKVSRGSAIHEYGIDQRSRNSVGWAKQGSICHGSLLGHSFASKVVEDACSRMSITLGVVLIPSLACVLNAFRDVWGAVPKWPWSSGFMRNSSRLANVHSMRFSLLLNSWNNLFATLPSIFSETWVM